METQTTFQQCNDVQRNEICPFRLDLNEDISQYAPATNYGEFLTILRKVFNQLDMGQIFQNLSGK